MNDVEAKRNFRTLLIEHNAIVGPSLRVSDYNSDYCPFYGSKPGGCEQALPSAELFFFLDPISATAHSYDYFGPLSAYTFYETDLSFVMGRGLCNPASLERVYLYYISMFNVPDDDCNLLYDAVHSNKREVMSVMKHSLQPLTESRNPSEVIEEFDLGKVKKGLVNSVGREGTLLEQDSPRILYCADSTDLKMCSSLSRVLTSDGIDFAFNAPDLDGVLLPQSGPHWKAFVDFLTAPLHMYNISN